MAKTAGATDLADTLTFGPASPPMPWSLGLEVSPAFYAIDNGNNDASNYANSNFRISLSYRFDDRFVGGISLSDTIKTKGKTQYYGEATLGYKFRIADSFSLTPRVGIGYTWNDTGIFHGADANADMVYYLLSLAGDLKVAPKLTWNVFNVRYRNAFDTTWLTPKVATGLTYSVTDADAVYANIGYSWKKLSTNTPPYDRLAGDKISIAVGYKRSF